MSMFNDISCEGKDNRQQCLRDADFVRTFAKRFGIGQWSFIGPGSEKKWYPSENSPQVFTRQYLSPRPPPKISLRNDLDWAKRDDDLGLTVEPRPVGKLVQQSLGETVHLDSSKLTQSPKTNRDCTGRPVAQEVVVGVLQEEPSSSDRPGRPVSREEQHVQTHDSSGRPESEEAQHIVQEYDNREHRETVDQFNLATNDANIDFSVSGIPEETR